MHGGAPCLMIQSISTCSTPDLFFHITSQHKTMHKCHFTPLLVLAGCIKLLHDLTRRAVKLLHSPGFAQWRQLCSLRGHSGLKGEGEMQLPRGNLYPWGLWTLQVLIPSGVGFPMVISHYQMTTDMARRSGHACSSATCYESMES